MDGMGCRALVSRWKAFVDCMYWAAMLMALAGFSQPLPWMIAQPKPKPMNRARIA
jgi:hypothetical protein